MIKITVNLGEYKVASAPASLITHSLGSCVGVTLYDPTTKLGGLAHIMLPKAPDTINCLGNPSITPSGKYASTAVRSLFDELIKSGVNKKHIVAKIAGGACMFSGFGNLSENMKIGEKNIEAVHESLASLEIPVISQDVGGNTGRTVELRTTDGKLIITSAFLPRKEI